MKESFIGVNGIDIRYVEKGEGRPVLLVHGNTGSARWYEQVMDLPGLHAVALDMPNFGRSGPLPGEISIERYADEVLAFSRAIGIERPIIIGHSLGGAVAMAMAAKDGAALSGLVLVDSAAPSGLVTPAERHPLIEAMRTNPEFLAQALRAVVPTLADEAVFSGLVEDARRMAVPAWIGNAEALGRFNLLGRLFAFKSPVLVLWGRKDPIVTEAMARETAAAFPNARLAILDHVGHSVMVEDPALFIRLVREFAAQAR